MTGLAISAKAIGMSAVLGCLCLLECARTAPPKMVKVDQSSNNTEISLSVGQRLEIALAENPTTGFRWELKEDGAPFCAPRGNAFEAPAAGLGKPGIRRWHFEMIQAGSATIALVYRRSFERDKPPAQVFQITVKIEK